MSQAATRINPANPRADRPTILRAQGVRKSFTTGRDLLSILKSVDLTVREGEFVAIEGKSGSGKSTLLHIIGGLDVADAGTLEFDGQTYAANAKGWLQPTPFRDWLRLSASIRLWICAGLTLILLVSLVGLNLPDHFALMIAGATAIYLLVMIWARSETAVLIALFLWLVWGGARLSFILMGSWLIGGGAVIALAILFAAYLALASYLAERPVCLLRTRSFGFVFQFYHLLPELNVLENTLMPAMVERSWLRYILDKPSLRARATEILKDLGLGERLRHRPNQLSGGERQRVAIARALMNRPRVLFADEPTGNLDWETGQQIMNVLEKLHRDNRQTIVMVTHDRTLAAQADRVLVLRNGRLERPEPDQREVAAAGGQ